jgi:predicted O-methyltransferase YrrM
MRLVANALYTRPRIEQALSALDKARLKLPVVNLQPLFDGFDDKPVTLRELPVGPWSSSVTDVVLLAKIALCLRARRVLEVGSYRGHTTKVLAEHTPADACIVAFDRDPRHGAAYRDQPLAAKIQRRVGEVSIAAFADDLRGHYDLIFLDADHTYDAVRRDTEVLLPLLAPQGAFVWHDYANWGRFSGKNGVPEVLHELAERLPVVAIGGSWLAMHMPAWMSARGAARLAAAQRAGREPLPGHDPWSTEPPS